MIIALDSCPLNIRRSSASLIQIDGPGTGAPGAVLRSAKPNLSPEGLFSRKANCLTNNRVPRREGARPDASGLFAYLLRPFACIVSRVAISFQALRVGWMFTKPNQEGNRP
jgi:hypothetical protein